MIDLSVIKAGDDVVIVSLGAARNERIATVTRLTGTQIIIGSTRFRRKDGNEIGASRWSGSYIGRLPNDEDRAKLRAREMRQRLSAIFAYRRDTIALSDEQIMAIGAIAFSAKAGAQ